MGARRQLTVTLLVPALAAGLMLLQPCAPPWSVGISPQPQLPSGAATTNVQPAALARIPVEPVATAFRPHTEASDPASLLASLLVGGGLATPTGSLPHAAAGSDPRVVELFVAVVREPRCSEGTGTGDTPAEYALQQLLLASRTDTAARAALGALAFDAVRVPAIHRERAARAYAGSATAHEVPWLRVRAESADDPLLRAALLAGLGDDSVH